MRMRGKLRYDDIYDSRESICREGSNLEDFFVGTEMNFDNITKTVC